jgi:purine-binding chemotaxis protein CheW
MAMPHKSLVLTVFILDDQRYALRLSAVDRIVRAVEVTSLPKAPAIVLGVVNVRGQIIPVVNLRRRFRLPERDIDVNDQFIIAHTSKSGPGPVEGRLVALPADAALGVVEVPGEKITTWDEIVPGLEYVQGVAKMEDGLILIHDLATFLSLDEEKALDEALRG